MHLYECLLLGIWVFANPSLIVVRWPEEAWRRGVDAVAVDSGGLHAHDPSCFEGVPTPSVTVLVNDPQHPAVRECLEVLVLFVIDSRTTAWDPAHAGFTFEIITTSWSPADVRDRMPGAQCSNLEPIHQVNSSHPQSDREREASKFRTPMCRGLDVSFLSVCTVSATRICRSRMDGERWQATMHSVHDPGLVQA
ncbi:hypothetical protein F5I97DRAFT_172937 [Phlebopus sp. FC_14]|nr:hypothetical protein F5I97DRAFT_172937 [Phlebopus sp. FC_14]